MSIAKKYGSGLSIDNPTNPVSPADHYKAVAKVDLYCKSAIYSGVVITSSFFFYAASSIGSGFGSGHNLSPL